MTADSLKKFQGDGYTPAAILESSPGNYQCLLTIPKLYSGFDANVGNRITEQLNRLYGDKKLSDCIHPHRTPGFENRKPKHRMKNGTFPLVNIFFAERCDCNKALGLSRQSNQEYIDAANTLVKQRRISPNGKLGNPISAYYAHSDNIRKYLSIDDYSRVDAMIALRMRSNGHSQAYVTGAVCACALS